MTAAGEEEVILIRRHDLNSYLHFIPARKVLVFMGHETARTVELSYAVSRLFHLLLSRPGELVTRDEILAYAWPGRIVSQNSVNQAVSILRKLLGDGNKREIIRTIPRWGYQFDSNYKVLPGELSDIGPRIDSGVYASSESTMNLGKLNLINQNSFLIFLVFFLLLCTLVS